MTGRRGRPIRRGRVVVVEWALVPIRPLSLLIWLFVLCAGRGGSARPPLLFTQSDSAPLRSLLPLPSLSQSHLNSILLLFLLDLERSASAPCPFGQAEEALKVVGPGVVVGLVGLVVGLERAELAQVGLGAGLGLGEGRRGGAGALGVGGGGRGLGGGLNGTRLGLAGSESEGTLLGEGGTVREMTD